MDALFHYCSTSTFASVVSNKSIWLSSLSLSNDALEGKLFSRSMDRILRRDKVPGRLADKVRDATSGMEMIVDALGLCLSEESDLLSQWRGYANDAKGFCIGFSKDYLESWSKVAGGNALDLYKVKYTDEDHEAEIRPVYEKIKALIDSGKLDPPGLLDSHLYSKSLDELFADHNKSIQDLYLAIFQPVFRLFTLKDYAFREEREWRLVSHVFYGANDSYRVRAADEKLIPYREFKLIEAEGKIITDVIIGPKNVTPIEVVSGFLKNHGFNDVNVRRSTASYR